MIKDIKQATNIVKDENQLSIVMDTLTFYRQGILYYAILLCNRVKKTLRLST